MDEIWQQFHRLPRVIRDIAARPQALTTIEQLEDTYPQLDLASFVMRVMIKQVAVADIPAILEKEAKLTPEQAQEVALALRSNVWEAASEYLGLQPLVASQVPPEPARATPVETSPTPPLPMMEMSQPRAPIGNMAPTPTLSMEDDAELAQHSARVRQLQTASGSEDFSALAQSVLSQHQLAFGDELLRKRAESILKSQMKGMRDETATAELLQRDPKVGGLGLDPDQSRLVAHSVVEVVQRMKTEGRVSATPMPMPPDITELPEAKTEKPAAMPPFHRDGVLSPDDTSKLPNVTEQPRPSRPIVRPPDIPPPPRMPETQPVVVLSNPPAPVEQPTAKSARPARTLDRRTISDITAPSSTLGPAEEMHALTLQQFRRLGQGANDITQKILQKFTNLQHESFALWAEAVKGWRGGEVYSLYLSMGRESLEQGIAITQVIERRAAKQLPYLSEHEFNALADLNRKLQL